MVINVTYQCLTIKDHTYKYTMDVGLTLQKYSIRPRGVIHIGAHMCQERNRYVANGISDDRIVWIEGNPMVYERCKFVMEHEYKLRINLFNAIIGDDADVEFHVPTWEEAGSICDIKPKEQSTLTELCSFKSRSTTLGSFMVQNNLDPCAYNFLTLDVQGAELLVLKGADLKKFDWIFTEVSEVSQYTNGVLWPELRDYLLANGFELVEYKTNDHGTFVYGDALFRASRDA